MEDWIGASWKTAGFVGLSTVAMYVSSLIGVRVAGRRTLSQMSAFDFLVTIALGSILATTALTRTTSIAMGVTALATLLAMQLAIAFGRQRSSRFQSLVEFSPRVVVSRGQVEAEGMRLSQMTREELASKLRQRGVFHLEAVHLAILEPTGELSIALRVADLQGESLADVRAEEESRREA